MKPKTLKEFRKTIYKLSKNNQKSTSPFYKASPSEQKQVYRALKIVFRHLCLQTKTELINKKGTLDHKLIDLPLPPANFSHQATSVVSHQKSTSKSQLLQNNAELLSTQGNSSQKSST